MRAVAIVFGVFVVVLLAGSCEGGTSAPECRGDADVCAQIHSEYREGHDDFTP
jgi:hypothetical protein